MMYENPLFARRVAFGADGCPFGAPYSEAVPRYGTGACPLSEELNRQFIWFRFVNPPNTTEDMDDVAAAFEKVLSHRAGC